jgi:hypothetical protein
MVSGETNYVFVDMLHHHVTLLPLSDTLNGDYLIFKSFNSEFLMNIAIFLMNQHINNIISQILIIYIFTIFNNSQCQQRKSHKNRNYDAICSHVNLRNSSLVLVTDIL